MGKLILCVFVVTRVLLFAFVTVFICRPFLSVLLVVPCMLSVLLVSGLALAAAQSCEGAGSPHWVLKEDVVESCRTNCLLKNGKIVRAGFLGDVRECFCCCKGLEVGLCCAGVGR